ncbi:MAG: ATP-binding protein [Thermodesulfobacteriota bacterium]
MTKRPKIWRKLLKLYLSVGLVSFLILGALSYRELHGEKLFSIESNLRGQVKQLDLLVDGFFSNIEAGVLVLANNPLVRTRQDSDFTNFTQADENTFVYRVGPTEERIIQTFALHKQYYQYVNSVYMGRENGGFVRSHKRARPTRYDPRERDWYILARENPGKVVRTKPYRSVTTDDINIGTTTALVDEAGRFYGVVGLDVTLKDLGSFVTNMKLDYDGRAALLTQDGEVLAATWTPLKGKKIKEVLPEETADILGLDSGCRMTRSGDFLLCHGTCARLGWKVLVITPMRVIDNEAFVISARLLAIALITLVVLGVLVAGGLQITVISRIQRLSGKAEEITRSGKLTPVLEPGPDDEIGAMSGSFNRMVAKLQNMDDQLRGYSAELEETVRIRTAELAEANQELENELGLRAQAEHGLKVQKAYLEQLFAASPEAIVLIDDEDRVLRVNSEFTRVFGFSPEEVIGRSLDDSIIPVAQRTEGSEIKKKIISGRRESTETKRRHKDGHLVDVSIIGTAVELGGNHYGVYGIYRNITTKKQQEEELRQAKEAAESADRLKSAFLASMSHELRTPLNSIIGFTGILLQQLPGPLNEEQKKQMGMVRKSARHLLELINDVLDISKIEAGQLELSLESFNFKESVEKVMGLIAPIAEKKGLAMTTSIDEAIGEIKTDRRRLEQVLLNFLSNAVKFTDQGSVQVESRLEDGRVVTRVIDTGIGIKPEDMAALFKAFSQIETGLARRYEGTGLGLNICRKLIELMGGTVRAESDGPGRGSTFVFDLPVVFEEV